LFITPFVFCFFDENYLYMNGNALLPEIKKFSLWNHLRCSMQIRKKVSIPVRRTELELILRLVFCLNGCLNLVNAHGSVLHGF